MRQTKFLTVTELTSVLNGVLSEVFPVIYFQGEVSQISAPASGHLYLTLKDEDSQLAAVIWRTVASKIPFRLEEGTLINCEGRPNIWNRSGRFQIVLSRVEPAGQGELQKRFLELKEKLEREGLFDVVRKRPLPFLPKGVGVVTSESGAVIHDIEVKIRERMPNQKVYLVPVKVQGEGAYQEIIEGIQYLEQSGLVDVIIVGRGGGSLEDLWAFNEEALVRAIFACRVPIVSAVGHEVDVTLADLVADERAPTPTAAGEMVVPKKSDLILMLDEYKRRLDQLDFWFYPKAQAVDDLEARMLRSSSNYVNQLNMRLKAAQSGLDTIRPDKLLVALRQQLGLFESKLLHALSRSLTTSNTKLSLLAERLRSGTLSREKILHYEDKIKSRERALELGFSAYLGNAGHAIRTLSQRLESMDHKKIMKRGYSVVRSSEGRVVSSVKDLHVEDRVNIVFHSGSASAKVLEKKGE